VSSVRERLILRPGPVVETIERLVARIFERFGDCGLYRLCAELHAIAKADTRRAVSIGRSYIWLRVLVFATIAAGIAVLGWMLSLIDFTSAASDSVSSTAQGIEQPISQSSQGPRYSPCSSWKNASSAAVLWRRCMSFAPSSM